MSVITVHVHWQICTISVVIVKMSVDISVEMLVEQRVTAE